MKPKFDKISKIISLVFIIMAVAVLLIVVYRSIKKISKICFENHCFLVEIAKSDIEKQKGLMNRESLGQNAGMLFVFNKEGSYSIWMKDTLIPLDVIWLDKKYQIVDIQTLSPCTSDPCATFTPKTNAKYVLEINAGLSAKYNFKIGGQAKLK